MTTPIHSAVGAPAPDHSLPEQTQTFSARLRTDTHDKHEIVSKSPFSKKLAEGTVSKEEYKNYLVFLHFLYSNLEFQLDEWRHVPCIESFTTDEFKALYRTKPLESDLKYFDAEEIDPSTATSEYATRIGEIALHKTHLLIAHAYIRYLGEFFGGRIIHTHNKDRWPEGMALYQFPEEITPKEMITRFREILDSLPLDDGEKQEIVEEVNWAYDQHEKVFNEILAQTLV